MNPATLIDLLRSRSESRGERRAYTFMADGERESACWSYGDLDRNARTVAARLLGHASPGDRVVLAYPPGLEFIAAFFGCLYAGAIAVPVPLPHPRRGHERLDAIVDDCEPRAVLSMAAGVAGIAAAAARSPRLASLPMLATDGGGSDETVLREPHVPGPDDLAMLQYTSGSTSAPKGVRVSHGNVIANLQMIHEAEGNDESSCGLSWLPAYHDMGLIEGILQPLYGGYPTWLMPPAAFLQRPARWLNAIADQAVTVSGGPNFAYELCVSRVTDDELEGLDLGSWRVAYNGAEPIRADTMDAFCNRFRRYGFNSGAVRPVYGLAEATALVTASTRGRDSMRVLRLDAGRLAEGRAEAAAGEDVREVAIVSCGTAPAGTRIEVTDPGTGRALAEGRVGEICVTGPSIASGYWRATQAEGHGFVTVAGDTPMLRTGDLGFVEDGELYVTGRIKDLVILRGRKIYPQDIERTVEASDARICAGGAAAFALQELHTDRLVIIAEVEATAQAPCQPILDAIADAVFRDHDCAAMAIVLVPRGALPRTSSAKLMRFRCREDYLSGVLPEIARSGNMGVTERRVA